VIVRFVDIGGIVDHHCVNFLFIKTKTIINEYKHRNTKDEPHGKRQHPGCTDVMRSGTQCLLHQWHLPC